MRAGLLYTRMVVLCSSSLVGCQKEYTSATVQVSIRQAELLDSHPTTSCFAEYTGASSSTGDCPDCDWSFYFDMVVTSEEGDCGYFDLGEDGGTVGLGAGEYRGYGVVMFYKYDGSWYPAEDTLVVMDGDDFSASYVYHSGPYSYYGVTSEEYAYWDYLGSLVP